MPELPEVESCRRLLLREVAGRRVVSVALLDPAVVRRKLSTRVADAHPDAVSSVSDAFVGVSLDHIERVGKRLAWVLGERAMLLHLGMTGRWVASEQVPRFARLCLRLDDGRALWFADQRRFGCLVPLMALDVDHTLRAGLGPDPIVHGLDGAALGGRLRGRRALKVALLDQAVVAGLGNIHAAEALFRARLDPRRAAGSLSSAELVDLAAAIVDQLREEIALLGDQPMTYVTEGGANTFAVYGRSGCPCSVCGGLIEVLTQSSRATFWCPACQRTAVGT